MTTALHHVEASGLLERRNDGTWLLTGSQPDELSQLDWHLHGLASAVGLAHE